MESGPFYEEAEGNRHDDGLHDAMLNDNPEADLVFQMSCVKIAMKRGVSEADAREIYGVPPARLK